MRAIIRSATSTPANHAPKGALPRYNMPSASSNSSAITSASSRPLLAG